MKSFSLYQLNLAIKETLHKVVPVSVWVRAEIHSISTNYAGHCYMDLIEKSPNSDNIIAKQRATVWASAYRSLSSRFESATGQPLRAGLNILVEVSVEFHELYGMSLNVRDIDPAYTLGDLQQRRLEIIERLRKRGLIDRNKRLVMPSLPQRIAVISSPTAAGYNDFIHQLHHNQYGFFYSTTLFPAVMQGSATEESVLYALSEIETRHSEFDMVVVIRGGGATSDLQAFDSELLAEKCAMFPLPIVSGIGHLRDESIIDMVAFISLKTPTAVAEYIVSLTLEVAKLLDGMAERISSSVTDRLECEKNRLTQIMQYLPQHSLRLITQSDNHLNALSHSIGMGVSGLLSSGNSQLVNYSHRLRLKTAELIAFNNNFLEQKGLSLRVSVARLIETNISNLHLLDTKVRLLDPDVLLNKGYSFTVCDGRVVTSSKALKDGDVLITTFADGYVRSVVTNKN